MGNSELNALVNAHHSGQVNRHDYRRLRRELVDKLVEQGIDRRADEQTSPMTLPRQQAQAETPGAPAPAKSPAIAVIVSLAMAGLIVTAYLYLAHKPAQDETSHRNIEPATAAAPAPWLEEFIAARSWDQAHINEFIRHWQGLDSTQRLELRNTPLYQRLKDDLSRHLAEQRALAELNNSQAKQQEARLLELSRALQK